VADLQRADEVSHPMARRIGAGRNAGRRVFRLADDRYAQFRGGLRPCQRERTDAELTETIREIHTDLHGHPGVHRVWAELVVRGLRVARKRVFSGDAVLPFESVR
jgi:hypothetical protein